MSVLAVDAGTSAIKAAIVGDNGASVVSARGPVHRGTTASIDPAEYWAAVAATMATVMDRPRPLDAVAVTGQGDGLWSLDSAGEASGPAYEWNTTTAAAVVRDWEEDGTIEAHYRTSGTVLWPGTSAALWRWLARSRPDQARRTSTVFCAKDWINNRLCGAVATDVTDATIPFLDLEAGGYSPDAFARLGCEDLAARVAPIRDVGSEIGRVSREAARRTGLTAGTPVLMGCLDGAAMIHGAGIADPGQALLVLGTTAAALVVVDAVDRRGETVGATLKLPGRDRFLRFLGTNSGTSTLDWYLDACGYDGDDRFERFWADAAAGQPGPYLMPYLAGERVPFLAPDATGALLGLTPRTGRRDLARSVAMGITFSLRHCLEEALPDGIDSVVLTGGGAAGAAWCQLVADVTGTAVAVDDRTDISCVGVAALVTGRRARCPVGLTVHEPSRSHESEFRQFVDLGRRLRPIWADLAAWSSPPKEET